MRPPDPRWASRPAESPARASGDGEIGCRGVSAGCAPGSSCRRKGSMVAWCGLPGRPDRGAREASHDIKTCPGRTCVARQATHRHQDGVAPPGYLRDDLLALWRELGPVVVRECDACYATTGADQACRAVGRHQALRCAARHHIGGVILQRLSTYCPKQGAQYLVLASPRSPVCGACSVILEYPKEHMGGVPNIYMAWRSF